MASKYVEERKKEFFRNGDRTLIEVEKDYNKYLVQERYMSENCKCIRNNFLGTKLGLACEYYLKGMILKNLTLSADNNEGLNPDYDRKIHDLVSALSEEDTFLFLASGIEIDELAEKYGIWNKTNNTISNKAKRVLTSQTIKAKGGNGHDLYLLIKELPQDVIDVINKFILEDPFYVRGKWYKNPEGSKCLNEEELNSAKIQKLNNNIEDSAVRDAFFKSRYGLIDGYQVTLETLFVLARALRKTVPLLEKNAIDICTYSGRDMSLEKIYVDSGSKIFVFDNVNKCEINREENSKFLGTRVYNVNQIPQEIKESEGLLGDVTIFPEYGKTAMQKANLSSGFKMGVLSTGGETNKSTLRISPYHTTTIIVVDNDKRRMYEYDPDYQELIECNKEQLSRYDGQIKLYEEMEKSGQLDKEKFDTITYANLEHYEPPKKRPTSKGLEENLDESALVDATNDKHGFREFFRKIKEKLIGSTDKEER